MFAAKHRWLIKKTRSTDFAAIMRGMRILGLISALIAFVASLTAIGLQVTAWPTSVPELRPFLDELRRAGNPAIWAAIAFDAVAAVAWAVAVTDIWVKAAGEQYAEALFATCDRR